MSQLTEDEKLHGKWRIMHKKNNNFDYKSIDLNNIKSIEAPPGQFYADPIVIHENNLYYVFFELYDYKKGKLAYYTLDNNLNASLPKLLDIDIQCHTSYPYIIKNDHTYYMIPETCHQNFIGLYECLSFPQKWRLKKTLIPNVHAGDCSVIYHNNLWYLFTVIYKNNRNYFCIYYSNNLLGEWKPHKLVNTDYAMRNEHLTRCGGQIFKKDGKIIKPSQYSDRGINGEAVTLYEIINLSPTEYHEVPLTIISKNNINSIRAMHTFSIYEELITLDGRDERLTDAPYIPIDMEKELKRILDNNFYVDHTILEEAFKCNTSGNGLCYYGINIAGKSYKGERKWEDRWDLIKDAIDYNNKSVLEIGCNMGIVLTYLKKFRNIGKAIGVDEPDDMLIATNKRDTIKAAKLLDKAFQVPDISYIQIDLNKVDYETILGTDFDIAVAMSIYKWIDDKDRFMKYLSKFKTVIYEGHDPDDIEIERFAKQGFSAKILGKTQTGVSYAADHTRTLILFTKE